MNSDKYKTLEQKKLHEIIREYVSNGYEVLTEPDRYPNSIKHVRPDAIALSKSDNVAIEVVSKNSMKDKQRLTDIAKAIESMPSWRFELVVTNPKVSHHESISDDQINNRLNTSMLLINQNMYEPALLNSWGAIEALLRKLDVDGHFTAKTNAPIRLVKSLYSLGAIARSEYEVLEKAAKARNAIVHGYEIIDDVDVKNVSLQLVNVGRSLMNQKKSEHLQAKGDYSVDELVDWFHENYKDPANGVPYESAEGGYVYINGGPYDAWDELSLKFPDADEKLIKKAVDIVVRDGFEWVRRDQY